MSWPITDVKKEKLKFIGDWLKKEFNCTDLCKRYDISRKTGYQLMHRYEAEGEYGLEERSHTRHFHPNQTPIETQLQLIELKHRYPKWGPNKLHDGLMLNKPQGIWPAASTIGDILKKHVREKYLATCIG
jgi:transposase